MPVIFFGHGSPMNALASNRYLVGIGACFPDAGIPVGQLSMDATKPARRDARMRRDRVIMNFALWRMECERRYPLALKLDLRNMTCAR